MFTFDDVIMWWSQFRGLSANMRRWRRQWSGVSLRHRYGCLGRYPTAIKRPWTVQKDKASSSPDQLHPDPGRWEKTLSPRDKKGMAFFWCDCLHSNVAITAMLRQGLTARFCMLLYYPILLIKYIKRDSETCNAPMWYIRGLIDGGTLGTYVIIWIFRAILLWRLLVSRKKLLPLGWSRSDQPQPTLGLMST